MDISKLLSSPVRIQVLQHLALRGEATTKQIALALPDIPAPTLYRHIGAMIADGVLTVKEERRKRGGTERLLCVNAAAMDGAAGNITALAYSFLMGLYSRFERYSGQPAPDPERDMLTLSTCSMELSDEQFTAFFTELGELTKKYIGLGGKGGKLRSVSIISAPACEEETK